MKFLRNICVNRENIRPVRRDGLRICLEESTPAFLGKSLCSLADEAPAL